MTFNIANPIGEGTDAELLAFTRAAIAQITLHGQHYTTRGRELTRADLRALREQEIYYEKKIAAASGSGGSRTNYAERKRPL